MIFSRNSDIHVRATPSPACKQSLGQPLCVCIMAEEDKLPVVSGISPKEGSPGTKITIRGENLGEDKDDIIGRLDYTPS